MDQLPNKTQLSIIPLTQTVLFPEVKSEIRLNKRTGEAIVKHLEEDDSFAIGLAIKESAETNPTFANKFHKVGALVQVKSQRLHRGGYHFQIQAIERVEVSNIRQIDKHHVAEYKPVYDISDLNELDATKMLDYMKEITYEISKSVKGSEPYVKAVESFNTIPQLMGYLMPFLNSSLQEKQTLLEINSLRERGIKFMDMLLQQKESIKLQMEMAQKFSEESNKNYRKAFLREQLKAIQQELNENSESGSKKKDYRAEIEAAGMPDEVENVALEELDKLEAQGPGSHESHVIRSYLDLLIALPWKPSEKTDIDINKARDILNDQHYGLEKVKERILQHLAVMKLKKEKQGSILLLVGPPGTGKTSLGKSIAEALERKYVRISLGGVRDEAEIRGHRRTYVGALPGRIIQGMKKAGERNPVFVLDEVDKIMAAYQGDPASALLEVLDPEQNNSFSDHYLEVPYDLSDVFFVATANTTRTIPGPLLDRMEVIELSSYTATEKFHIGKDHLIDLVLEEHGLTREQIQIEEDAIKSIIDKYTQEAGVRGLRKQLTKLARVVSEKIVSAKVDLPYVISNENIEDLLGNQVTRHDMAQVDNPPGVSTGLAWTPVGGEILFVEAMNMEGTGQLTLTGQLGDVMKESAKISLSLVRSRLAFNLNNIDFKKSDLHIHVPSGSMPKDGPSAGVALFTSVASLLMKRKIDPQLAMTGEITLRGSILPVGGIKEKVLAAHRAEIKKIILPKENKKDLKDVPEDVKEQLSFVFIDTIEDLIKETLGIELPKQEAVVINRSNEPGVAST
ncbi:MAG: endopeptidase La [Proteobacteria bacterium]|nr:endopeptidase La [Pseudomonadota bacterium]